MADAKKPDAETEENRLEKGEAADEKEEEGKLTAETETKTETETSSITKSANDDNGDTDAVDDVEGENEKKVDSEPAADEENSNVDRQTSDDVDNKKLDYGLSLLHQGIYFDSELQINPHLINSLTTGFTEKFLPSLEKNRKTILQIKSSQTVLVETVQQENTKFKDCQALDGLEKTMSRAKLYQARLLRLRKEMTALHEKSSKLKRRALKLQQHKQKEEMTRAQQMESEYEKEKMLTARIAACSPSPSPSPPSSPTAPDGSKIYL